MKDIDTSCEFLGRRIRFPIMIASLTGGPELARKINENLATGAQLLGVPLALGSARTAVRDPSTLPSFQARRLCPDIPLLANLGLVDLEKEFDINDCREMMKAVEADALIFHLDSVHEALQDEGNTCFSGLLDRLRRAVEALEFPILVKEVGFGISAEIFGKLNECGLYAIDISGSGGVSWGVIESRRAEDPVKQAVCRSFSDWGIPTASILESLKGKQRTAKLIASGGIRSGVDAFKAICLGADIAAAGLPFLEPAMRDARSVADLLRQYLIEFRIATFSTGCRELNHSGCHLLAPAGRRLPF